MEIGSRLIYSLIGLVGGALFGVLLWVVFDFGFRFRWSAYNMHIGLREWVKYSAGFFALAGFLFQDRVGSALGFGLNKVYEDQVRSREFLDTPIWLTLAVLAAVSFAVWHFTQ